jgi:hypothetical protein
MPTYSFLNSNTNELEDHVMRMGQLDEFKKQNPHLERYFAAEDLPVYSDSSRLSVPRAGQPDGRFEREIIGRIKEKVPGNVLHMRHKTKMPREW